MANAVVGRVLLMPKGNYSADITYNMLDLVRHDNKSWVCKQTCVGQIPQAGDYWQLMASDGAEGGYCYIRYSANSDGTGFVSTPTENTIYIGFYTGDSETAPAEKTDYTWSKYAGIDGTSASASVSKIGKVATITCQTGYEEPTEVEITDGNDGSDGVSMRLAGEWGSGNAYVNDGVQIDIVSKSGNSYGCLQSHTASSANQPPNYSYWQLLAQRGNDGSGTGDMNKSTYDTDNDGVVDMAETLNGLTSTIDELNYTDGVTGNVQEQLDKKAPTTHEHAMSDVDGLQDALNAKQPLTNGLTAETGLADADTVPFYDASNTANRKSTWANIKAVLKTYFDTLYNKYVLPIGGSSLGGVKNGGNVTIDEDGEMNAEVGAGNVINITTQETDLFMQTVTATSEDGEIATAKFNIVGQATLYAPFTGLITLSASNASGTDEATSRIMSHHFSVFHVELKFNELYGFCVDTTNNSPSDAVTYLAGYDNEFYTPAKMNYVTGVFDYGSWKSAFFLRESRWVMLKSDGTIDYDLDRENHAKKASDGSASDVSNEAYDGNAMFACVNSYIKFWQEEGDLGKIYFAVSKKPLDGFQNYAHHDNNGNTMPYTFIRMFDGTLVSGKLRSLANNATPLNNVTGTEEIGYAQANGDYWYTGLYNDRVLINNLLLLMGKSRDTQTTFGNGHYEGGSSAASLIKTGTMLDKGLFYGTNGTGVGVKVFGIENWWGNNWERIGGYMYVSNLQQVKLTYGTEDGSTTTGYNTTGSGYIAIPNSDLGGTSGGYTSAVSFYDKGFVPKTVSGSQSTHWCDGCWFSNNTYAPVGGACNGGFLAGAFCVSLHTAVSYAGWSVGASVSCKPPVN